MACPAVWALTAASLATTAGAVSEAAQAGRPGVYPADFALVLDLPAARKFTVNDIESFVHRIFSMYERATTARARSRRRRFARTWTTTFASTFPTIKIRNWQEFVTWHHSIHDRLIGDDHAVGPIDVRFLRNGRYEARFFVVWRALFKNGDIREVRVEQTWTMREQSERDWPVIETYTAKIADFRARD